jgi:hypothetical protein
MANRTSDVQVKWGTMTAGRILDGPCVFYRIPPPRITLQAGDAYIELHIATDISRFELRVAHGFVEAVDLLKFHHDVKEERQTFATLEEANKEFASRVDAARLDGFR